MVHMHKPSTWHTAWYPCTYLASKERGAEAGATGPHRGSGRGGRAKTPTRGVFPPWEIPTSPFFNIGASEVNHRMETMGIMAVMAIMALMAMCNLGPETRAKSRCLYAEGVGLGVS